MKWMSASDIHGSALYCEKMLQCFETENADRLLLLGDLLYHGPRNDLPEEYRPKKVIEMLNGIRDRLLCVRGNCDCEVDQMVLNFPILADYAVLDAGNKLIYATHGHVFNPEKLPPPEGGRCAAFRPYTCAAPYGKGRYSVPESGICFHPEGRQRAQLYDLGRRCFLLENN